MVDENTTWLGRNLLPDELLGTASDETLWERVRSERDALLIASDWTQLADVDVPNRVEWTGYRQALRDCTSVDDPRDVVLPDAPGGV